MLCLQKGDQATGDFIVAVRTLTHIPNTTAYCICVWRTEMFAHEKSQHFVHLFRCGLSQESKGFQADATLLFVRHFERKKQRKRISESDTLSDVATILCSIVEGT